MDCVIKFNTHGTRKYR